jgi:hypothetical protein
LSRHLERAWLLPALAAETTNDKKANRLATRAMKSFKRVHRIAANAALRGTGSFGRGQRRWKRWSMRPGRAWRAEVLTNKGRPRSRV